MSHLGRRVVVTGLGAVTPLGVGAAHAWGRLLDGDRAIGSVLDAPWLNDGAGASGSSKGGGASGRGRWHGLTSTVAGLVPHASSSAAAAGGTSPQQQQLQQPPHLWDPSRWLTAAEQRRMSKFAQYAVAAADMALEDAGLLESGRMAMSSEELDNTGVCLGSGIGNLDEMYETSLAFEEGGYKKVSPLFVPKLLINLGAGHIAMRHSLRGPNHSATTACTTGAHSIGDALRFILHGDADVMVAGGSEACVHPLTLAGFGRSRSLSTGFNSDPASACRPFDARRDGFVVGEGAAVLVLEELGHATARGARVYAELAGYGCSGDAYHLTAPRPDGAGALMAMRKALRDAGTTPARVGYVNAHATGTEVGDLAEARAIRALMLGEDGVDSEADVTVSSTKGAVGHLLGAAGAIEAMFAVLAVAEGAVPPTVNLVTPDVGIEFNFVPGQAQQKQVDVAVTNSFGFGGTSATLVFTKQK